MRSLAFFVTALGNLPLATLVLLVALAALGLAGFAIYAVLTLAKIRGTS